MSQHVSLAEFEANLRRYYHEDELSRAQVKDLYRQWRRFRDTPYGLLAFERSFLRENNPANGLAWAEERWAAHPDPGWHPELSAIMTTRARTVKSASTCSRCFTAAR